MSVSTLRDGAASGLSEGAVVGGGGPAGLRMLQDLMTGAMPGMPGGTASTFNLKDPLNLCPFLMKGDQGLAVGGATGSSALANDPMPSEPANEPFGNAPGKPGEPRLGPGLAAFWLGYCGTRYVNAASGGGVDAWAQNALDWALGDAATAYARGQPGQQIADDWAEVPSNGYRSADTPQAWEVAAAAAAASASWSPSAAEPVMPAGLSEADQALWRKCAEMHSTYKLTDAERAAANTRLNPIEYALQHGRASPADVHAYCVELDAQIDRVQRLHEERSVYMKTGCDKFDWFNNGTTEAYRYSRHQAEVANVDANLRKLYTLRNQFCR